MEQDDKVMTFWDHLEELRGVLFRIVGVVALFTIIGFCFKDQLFAVVLAPKESDFIFYRFLCRLSELLGIQFHAHQYSVGRSIYDACHGVHICRSDSGFAICYI